MPGCAHAYKRALMHMKIGLSSLVYHCFSCVFIFMYILVFPIWYVFYVQFFFSTHNELTRRCESLSCAHFDFFDFFFINVYAAPGNILESTGPKHD